MSNNQNKDGFCTGVVLVIVGIFALCATFFDIDINWSNLSKLWPLILVITGVCIIPVNRWIKTGVVLLILICGAVGYACMECNSVCIRQSSFEIYDDDFDEDFDDDWDDFYEVIENQGNAIGNIGQDDMKLQEFSEPFRNAVMYGEVEVDYGAGEVIIEAPTENLICASNRSPIIRQGFNVKYEGNEAEVKFTSENKNVNANKKNSKFAMSLNANPVWELDFALGACTANLDFSNYKVSKIDFDGGASNVDLKIGTLYNNTKIDIESGVSKFIIRIPESAGCRINSESAFSNKTFNGFSKISNNVYETDNYGMATQNIEIELSCAISVIDVVRY